MSSILKLLRSNFRLKSSSFTNSLCSDRILGENVIKYHNYHSQSKRAILHKNSSLAKLNTVLQRAAYTQGQVERQSRYRIPEELWVLLIVGEYIKIYQYHLSFCRSAINKNLATGHF